MMTKQQQEEANQPQEMRIFEEAIKNNNRGVVMFEEGLFHEALMFFNNASSAMIPFANQTAKISSSSSPSSTTCIEGWSNNPRDFEHTRSGGVYIFPKAVILSSPQATTNCDDERLHMESSAAILYNIALCHHVVACELDSSSIHQRASELYRLSQVLLQNVAKDDNNSDASSSSNHHSFLLLKIALLNNLGHILQCEVGEVALAQECYGSLRMTLVAIEMDYGLKHFGREDVMGLLTNTFVENTTSVRGAGAA